MFFNRNSFSVCLQRAAGLHDDAQQIHVHAGNTSSRVGLAFVLSRDIYLLQDWWSREFCDYPWRIKTSVRDVCTHVLQATLSRLLPETVFMICN